MVQILMTLAMLSSTQAASAQTKVLQYRTTVKDVTAEYQIDFAKETLSLGTPTPTPAPTHGPNPQTATHGNTNHPDPAGHVDVSPTPDLPPSTDNPIDINPSIKIGGVDLDTFITLGGKVWDFIVNNKPTADYQIFKSSIVPSGITDWTQLQGWKRPVAKIYRVEFKNLRGAVAGSFDYRITFVAGGSYNGKGKYLGEISFVPLNIKLNTDRSLMVRAELSTPLNFGSEQDPVAGAQMIVTWSSPTTLRYQMNSASLFIYGTGEIENLTNGN
ncbi:MAG: hypothetical protein H7333_00310 [Bdellovibrionales bacterium]|nr:hypothetical protein [Oligoflexia bacterium]